MQGRILIIDDERGIADAIAYALRKEGYEVDTGYSGEDALNKIGSFSPQVLILDVMMPKISGYDVLERLRNRRGMGVILLTARNDIVDKVLGLGLGADDYITKPFDIREVTARVHSLVRRLERVIPEEVEEIQRGGLKIILPQRRAFLGEEELELAPKEYDLLVLLLSHPERVFTRDELLDRVWGMEYAGGTRTVDTHIQRLRKKLGDPLQNILQTVYSIGYKAVGGSNEEKH